MLEGGLLLKKFLLMAVLFLCGCQSVHIPETFAYKEIKTDKFTLASWQKLTDAQAPVKIYIEGDGYAFNALGRPTKDPTPREKVLRDIAFGDNSPNVVYLARPCQFVKDNQCQQKYWTSARFSKEVIDSEKEAVLELAQNRPTILIGFSGGAQVAGLIAVTSPELEVKKMITIAGNLDHRAWADYHHVATLSESLNLADYKEQYLLLPQEHYVGYKDKVVPMFLTEDFVDAKTIIEVPDAEHGKGWERIYPLIQLER